MKVFISYSSIDKWIARKISEELEAFSVITFLDEKDIETGESIDEAIDAHLKECDELLVLISPAALKSHWVLIEVGGAMALNKRIVPILLHVPQNDLPAPLIAYLARDLNDINKYYGEVRTRLKGKNSTPPSKIKTRPPIAKKTFDKGNHAVISRRGKEYVFPG